MRFLRLCAAMLLLSLVAMTDAGGQTGPAGTARALMTRADLISRPLPAPSREIRLGARPFEVVDLGLPDGPGPYPVVVMAHGECWQKAIADRTLMNCAAEDLRQRGLAVRNIEYRGVDEPGGGYPGTFQDVARAADALRAHAARYNLRTDRIAAFGHSAGGHLALWLAARGRLPAGSPLCGENPLPVMIIVNSGGLADLADLADLAASAPVTLPSCLAAVMDRLIGAPRPDTLADASPAEILPIDARQISVNGARDRIAPPLLGEEYAARARAAGDPAEVVVIPDEGHVELNAPGSAAFEAQARVLVSFFKENNS